MLCSEWVVRSREVRPRVLDVVDEIGQGRNLDAGGMDVVVCSGNDASASALVLGSQMHYDSTVCIWVLISAARPSTAMVRMEQGTRHPLVSLY